MHVDGHYALTIYLLIALIAEFVMVRLNVATMRTPANVPGRWDAEDVAWTIVLAALWPVSLGLLLA
jgi:hypothetical protein